ncbi:hypothetical protein TNCV_753951 [Trichonephila clavipes]|nr:hypothetical protein TNCV_753951 [Trichonephila clavipes]
MVSHPPLAPSDFHLFPELKKKMAEPNSRQMKRCKTRLLIFYTDRRQSSITLKNPKGPELANMAANVAKVVTKLAENLLAKYDANSALSPSSH